MKNKIFNLSFSFVLMIQMLSLNDLFGQNEIIGYTYLGQRDDHFYYLSNCASTWEEANAAAAEMGGYLATITSYNENYTLGFWVINHAGENGAWIGFRGVNGVYEWVTGEPTSFETWLYFIENNEIVYEPVYVDGAAIISDWDAYGDYSYWISAPFTDQIQYVVEFPFQPNCNNPNKTYMCHNGNTICVNNTSLQSHLDHGDLAGPCGPCNTYAMQSTHDQPHESDDDAYDPVRYDISKAEEELNVRSLDQINVFPNPASDEINVALPNIIHEGSLRIFSSTGQEIQTIAIHGQQSMMIDLSDYTPGIYLIDVSSINGNYQKKFVKL